MDTNLKSSPVKMIGIIGFAFLTLMAIVGLVNSMGNYYYTPTAKDILLDLLIIAGYIVLLISTISGGKSILSTIGLGLITFVALIELFSGYSFFSKLVYFIFIAMILIVNLAVNTKILEAYKEKITEKWLIPAGIAGGLFILSKLFAFIGTIFEYYASFQGFFYYVILNTINILTFLTFAMLLSPAKLPGGGQENTSNQGQYNQAGTTGTTGTTGATMDYRRYNAYYPLLTHVLLLIFTFGIWLLIWIYRVTGYLNRVQGEQYRNPTTKLLLCMFVPFYYIYWTYKTAQLIDKWGRTRNLNSDLATICLVASFFVAIIPPILMQDKLNNLIDMDGGNSNNVNANSGVYNDGSVNNDGYRNAQANSNVFNEGNVVQPVEISAEAVVVEQPVETPVVVEQPVETPVVVEQPTEAPAQAEQPAAPVGSSNIEEIKVFKELLDSGVITQEEFDLKKKELLGL